MTISFTHPYRLTQSAYSVTTADINGDGKPDLVVGGLYGGVEYLLGDGSGAFGPPVAFNLGSTSASGTITYGTGGYGVSATAADINGDGRPDILFTGSAGGIYVMLNLGSQGFTAATEYLNVDNFVLADVNRDGKLDIVARSASGGVAVLLNDGTGHFGTATTVATGTNPAALAVGDVNNDGKPDLVIGGTNGGVAVMLGNGDGTFGPAKTYAGPAATALTLADMDGDGNLDVVETTATGVAVMLGLGDGSFGSAVMFGSNTNASTLAVADLNGDGKPDVVDGSDYFTRFGGGGQVELLLGTGAGALSGPNQVSNFTYPASSVAIADLNGDGRPDVISSGYDTIDLNINLLNLVSIKATASAPGRLASGAIITFTLNAPAPVLVTGSPTLSLNNGGTATYVAGSGTSSLTFTYTVGATGGATPDLKVIGLNGTPLNTLSPPTFAATTYAAGTTPVAVATADLNNDGRPDLVVIDQAGAVQILLGTVTGGSFGPATPYAAGPSPAAIAIADLNRYGRKDLLVADQQGGLAVLLNNGNGTFATAQTYAAGPNPQALAVADLNQDGKTDAVVADYGGGVSILLGDGNGGFTPATTYAAGPNPDSIAIADINNDGKLDLIVADASGGVAILLADGQGGFGTPTFYAAGPQPASVTTADLNGDAQQDLIVADAGGGVSVLLNRGNGTFAPAVTYAAGLTPISVTTADLNGDGKPDLAVADAGGGISILIADGTGAFAPPIAFATGAGPVALATADLDRNGQPDLVVAGQGGATVLLDNTPQPGTLNTATVAATPGADTGIGLKSNAFEDFNGDGQSDLLFQGVDGSISVFLQSGFTYPAGKTISTPGPTWHVVASADFNGDGQPDILLQNDNGAIVDFLMAGTTLVASYTLTNPGPSWHVRGAADFNGDGKADLVLQNDSGAIVVEYVNGQSVYGGAYIDTTPGYTVEGVADFNGDGQPDLLLQNTNGALVDYLMSGTTVVAGYLLSNPGPGWTVAGTGDYNHDGFADFVLHNDNGTDVIVDTRGQVVSGSSAPLGSPGAAYSTAIAGLDLNGDGSPDLLLENTANGLQLSGFLLNSAGTVTKSGDLGGFSPGTSIIGTDPMQFIDGTGATLALTATPGPNEFNLATYAPGAHTIAGFDPVKDIVVLAKATFPNYAAVQSAETSYQGSTYITLPGGSSLTIQGVQPLALTTSDFIPR